MPKNKNAAFRYRLINHCLRNRARKWAFDDLLEYVSQRLSEELDVKNGISERSLRADIALMRKDPPTGYGAPILIHKGIVSYTDPDYSIDQVPLNDADREALCDALSLLGQLSGLPHVEALLGVSEKLGVASPSLPDAVVWVERNEHLAGLHHLRSLYRYIREQQPLRLQYRPFGTEEPLEPLVHPYWLKEYNNRWFLFGWSQHEALLRVYALDRIERLSPAGGIAWMPNAYADPNIYFNDIIGVSIPENAVLQNIRLRFSAYRAPYLLTKPLHPSQRLIALHSDGSAELEWRLIPNPELRTILLGFGPDVEVLSPPELREEMAAQLSEALERYLASE